MRSSVLLLALVATSAAAEATLDGAWTVDLSSTPDTTYTQPMQLTLQPDGRVAGTFYQSTIEAGRWKRDRGRLCASFRTSDGKGPYHTAVCLQGDTAVGQTWAEHRDFLFNWVAARTPTPAAESTPPRP